MRIEQFDGGDRSGKMIVEIRVQAFSSIRHKNKSQMGHLAGWRRCSVPLPNVTNARGSRERLLSAAAAGAQNDNLERKYTSGFNIIFDAVRELMTPPKTPKRRIRSAPQIL